MITYNNKIMTFNNRISHYTNIVTGGLIYYADANNYQCYSGQTNTTGTTYNDLIGISSGSLSGNTTFKTGPNRFDTNNTSATTQVGYLTLTPTITFNDGSEYTFDTWVRIEDNPTGSTSTNSLIGKGALYPYIYLSIAGTSSWRPVYRENSGGTAHLFTSMTSPILVNIWNNITFVITSSREVKLYVNGIYNSSVNPVSTYFQVTRIIGGYQTGGIVNPFLGSMTQFKIYNRSLSDVEVLQNYNAIKTIYQ